MKNLASIIMNTLQKIRLALESMFKWLFECAQKILSGLITGMNMIQHIFLTLSTISSALFFLVKNKMLLSLSSLKDFFSAFSRSFFEKLLAIAASISSLLKNGLSKIGEIPIKIIEILQQIMRAVLIGVTYFGQSVKNGYSNFSGATLSFLTNCFSVITTIFRSFFVQMSSAIFFVKNKILSILILLRNQTSALTLRISQIVTNIFVATTSFFMNCATSLFSVVSQLSHIKTIFFTILSSIKNGFSALAQITLNAARSFSSRISQLFSTTKNSASTAKDITKAALSSGAGYLFVSTKNITLRGLAVPKQLLTAISSWISALSANTKNILLFLGQSITSLSSNILSKIAAVLAAIKCALSNAFSSIIDSTLNAGSGIKNILTNVQQSITSLFSNALTGISNAHLAIKTALLNALSSIIDSTLNIGSETKNIFSSAVQSLSSLCSNAATGISNTLISIKTALSTMFSSISSSTRNATDKTTGALSGGAGYLLVSVKNMGLKGLNLHSTFISTMMLFFRSSSDNIKNFFSILTRLISSIFSNVWLLIINALIAIQNALQELFSSISNAMHTITHRTTETISALQQEAATIFSRMYHASINAFLSITTTIINAFSAITNSTRSAGAVLKNKTTQGVWSAHEKTKASMIMGKNNLFAVYFALQAAVVNGFRAIFITAPQQIFRLLQSFGLQTITLLGAGAKSLSTHLGNGKNVLIHGAQLSYQRSSDGLSALGAAIKSFLLWTAQKISMASRFVATTLMNVLVTQPIKILTVIATTTMSITQTTYSYCIYGCVSLWTNTIAFLKSFFTQTHSVAQKTYSKTSSFISPKAVIAHDLSKKALYGAAGFVLFKVPYSVFVLSRTIASLLQRLTTACAIILAQIITKIYRVAAFCQNMLLQIIVIILTPIRATINFIKELSQRITVSTTSGIALTGEYILSLPAKIQLLLLFFRFSIQKYSILCTTIYLALTVFTTYHTNIIHPIFDEEVKHAAVHPHAIAVDTGFELQSLKPVRAEERGDYGNVAVEGIVSYSYHAGTESAADMDAVSIKNASPHTVVKKLDSHINQNRIVKTRMYIKTVLSTMPSKSPRFPFAPVKSTMTLQNNSLSSKDIYYKGAYTSLALNNEISGLAQIHLEPSNTNAIGYGERRSVPEINITFEHKGIATYTILLLYTIILGLTLLSIASLMISTSKLSVILNAASLLGIGIMWLTSYLQQLIPIMNHLLLTLLICFAIGLLSFSLNLSNQSKNNETADFKGQTRWIIALLSILSLFLTLLISF